MIQELEYENSGYESAGTSKRFRSYVFESENTALENDSNDKIGIKKTLGHSLELRKGKCVSHAEKSCLCRICGRF